MRSQYRAQTAVWCASLLYGGQPGRKQSGTVVLAFAVRGTILSWVCLVLWWGIFSGAQHGCYGHTRVGTRVPKLVVFDYTRVCTRVPSAVVMIILG